jgi:SAM-dependent methyltransferase
MKIYRYPEYYEITFQYREIEKECDFITNCMEKFALIPVRSVLDIACGAGSHLFELARRGYDVTGFDLSREMVEYVRKKSKEEGIQVEVGIGKLQRFELGKRFDAAICMLDSFPIMLKNDEILNHMKCVAKHLNSGGIYIIEFSHPMDDLLDKPTCKMRWKCRSGRIKVKAEWRKVSEIDPVLQTYDCLLKIKVRVGGRKEVFVEKYKRRLILPQDFKILAERSGDFDFIDYFGAWDIHKKLNAQDAWRMIAVLRRT